MSKVEAEARKKIEKSKKGKSTKYSQSGQFFKKFQDTISSKDKSKPNPNINKLKLWLNYLFMEYLILFNIII